MNGHFDYCLKLIRFRNVDLPLQGVYFLRLSLSSNQAETRIVPYAATCLTNMAGLVDVHSLLPPEVAPDDGMHSTGFLVQFSDEEVRLGDVFRISLKVFTHVNEAGELTYSARLTLMIELLFSNAAEVGGLDRIQHSPSDALLPVDYVVVATQSTGLHDPGSAQFFRTPLGLVREYETLGEAEEERSTGDIFPCAFVEGVVLSSLVGHDANHERQGSESALCGDELISYMFGASVRTQEELFASFGINPLVEDCNESTANGLEADSNDIVSLSSSLFLRWNHFLAKWCKNAKLGPVMSRWRTELISNARSFMGNVFEVEGIPGNNAKELWYLLDQSRVPRLSMDNCAPLYSTSWSQGAHMVFLVHGYQGSASDMRVIRNMLICLCPDTLILSSRSNEDQTEGDIEIMGVRLAMEVRNAFARDAPGFGHVRRISFIAHSLGGLIVRCALTHLSDFKDRMSVFVTLSTPHIGITNSLIGNGVLLLSWFKRSECLDQLTLRDSQSPTMTLLHRMSEMSGMSWFKRVILVGSSQDQYAPISSSNVSPSLDDDISLLLASNIIEQLITERLVRVSVVFKLPDGASFDSVIGRVAHIKFLESPVVIQLLLLLNSDVFDI